MGTNNGSAGVETREIDISGISARTPAGTPACIISPTVQGPAFVPTMVTTLSDYVSVFGGINVDTPLGYLTAREWFDNSTVPLVQVRVLGAGTGASRNANGIVTGAGFVVGEQQPVESAVGIIGNNGYANAGGVTGSVYMLGCFMSQSANSTVFSDAGLQTLGQNVATPIVRGVLFAPSGVVLRLSSAASPSAAPSTAFIASESSYSGSFTGSLNIQGGAQNFVMILNGHKGTATYPNVISASFDPTAISHFPSMFNTDPLKIEQAGHLLYSNFNIYPSFAQPTGSGIVVEASASIYGGAGIENIAFLVPGSGSAATHTSNIGTSVTPNYEGFQDRFGSALSPWVISQGFGGNAYSLFRFHHLSDGESSNNSVKISIANIQPGTATQPYGFFDVIVRQIDDGDDIGTEIKLEPFTKCTLDPTSPNYIGKKIGSIHNFFNFDTDLLSQKIVTTGEYPSKSRYIRVEIADAVEAMEIDPSAIPFGFRGPQHLVTAGSSSLYNIRHGDILAGAANAYFNTASIGTYPLYKAVQPPIPMRLNLKKSGESSSVSTNLYWGVNFQTETSATDPNMSREFNKSILGYSKFYPSFDDSTDVQFSVYDNTGTAMTTASYILDSDKFNNNLFTLEKIKVVTGSAGTPDTSTTALLNWQYVRSGIIVADNATKTRALQVSDLVGNNPVQSLAKFSFYLERGFDGVRVFNNGTRYLKNIAAAQEIAQTSRGLTDGPTVKSYIKSLNIISDVNEVNMHLLVIPGIRERFITDAAITTVEKDRFDCFYIMDIEQFSSLGASLTGSYTNVSTVQTALNFSNRGVNSSFAAAYYPDVNIRVGGSGVVYEKMPPSVVVFGVYGKNDTVGQVFNAPAGSTRATLTNVTDFAAGIDKTNADTLYLTSINPLLSKPGVGPVVWGQKTTLAKESLLNRVNVRRLLIAIRREVRKAGNQFMFEPAREETLKAFNAAVQPIMQRYQAAGGVQKYKVAIDASTTTQADLDNKTLRGKIFLIPTTSLEFLSIDFVVTSRENFVG